MKTTCIALMAMLMLLAGPPAATAMCIDVDLRFVRHQGPAALVDAMMRETSSIWESYGVHIEWTTEGGTARCAWPLGSLDVAVEHARQSSTDSRAVLGRTRVMRREIDHAPIHIDRAATERLIDLLSVDEVLRAVGRPRAGPADVGRALGRVLAHEIGHVILAATDHELRGLMRPTFESLDLIRPQREPYTLSPEEVAHLRARERLLDEQLKGTETQVVYVSFRHIADKDPKKNPAAADDPTDTWCPDTSPRRSQRPQILFKNANRSALSACSAVRHFDGRSTCSPHGYIVAVTSPRGAVCRSCAFSSRLRASRKACRARESPDITLPMGIPSTSASS